MAIFPRPEPLGPRTAIRGAVRAVDLATGGVVGQIGRVIGARSPAEDAPRSAVAGRTGRPITNAAAESGLPQWGQLSRHLIARLYLCNASGTELTQEEANNEGLLLGDVQAPATQVNQEVSLNWQSPFENSGPESKAPTIMAMIQTGQIATIANALQAIIPGDNAVTNLLKDAATNSAQWATDLEGRTGITKLNSRQVFSGMPPIKITMVLHFRAFSDPQAEVMAPYQRLLEWSLPKQLAKDGVLSELIKNGGSDFVKSLFPSEAPPLIGFRYMNNRYSPMVIESLGSPLDGPVGRTGLPIYRSVQLSLATLTALDRNDVARIFSRSV